MRSECRAQPSPPPLSCTARTLSHVGKTKLNVPDIIAHTLLTMGFCHPFDVGILLPMSCLVSCLKYSNIFLLKFYVKDERKLPKKMLFLLYFVLFTFTFSSFSFKTSIDTKVWTKSETQVAHSHLCSNLIFVDFSIWNYKIIGIARRKKLYFSKAETQVACSLAPPSHLWSNLIILNWYSELQSNWKRQKNDNCTFPKEKRRLQSSTRGQQYLIWSKRDYIQPKDWIII